MVGKKWIVVLGIVVVLALAYAFGLFGYIPHKVDVGFMFDNAPSSGTVIGSIYIDGQLNSAMSEAQGGFVHLDTWSSHTYSFDFGAKKFSGDFTVPNFVPKGEIVIIHIDWITGFPTVETRV